MHVCHGTCTSDAISAHASSTTPALRQFLEKRFLFWLEVLSVLGAVKSAIEGLHPRIGWGCVEPPCLAHIYSDGVQEPSTLELSSLRISITRRSCLPPKIDCTITIYESHAYPFTTVTHGLPCHGMQMTRLQHGLVDLNMMDACSRQVGILCRTHTFQLPTGFSAVEYIRSLPFVILFCGFNFLT